MNTNVRCIATRLALVLSLAGSPAASWLRISTSMAVLRAQRSAERADRLGQLRQLERRYRSAELLFHPGRHPDDGWSEGHCARQGAKKFAIENARSTTSSTRCSRSPRPIRRGSTSASCCSTSRVRIRAAIRASSSSPHSCERRVYKSLIKSITINGDKANNGRMRRHSTRRISCSPGRRHTMARWGRSGIGRRSRPAATSARRAPGCGTNNIIFVSNGSPNENNTDAKALLQNAGGDTTLITYPPGQVTNSDQNNWSTSSRGSCAMPT